MDQNQARSQTPPAVFFDPSGLRARRLRWVALIVALLAGVLICGFALSVVVAPRVAGFAARHATHTFSPIVKKSHHSFTAVHSELAKRIQADKRAAAQRITTETIGAEPISGAYFTPWEDAGLDSFRAHADELNRVYATWIELTADGRGLDTSVWDPQINETTRRLVEAAHAHGVRIIPVVSNASDGKFDPQRLRRMLGDPKAAAAVADALVSFVKDNHYDGLQIDFELIDERLREPLAAWCAALGQRLHAMGDELSMALELDLSDASVRAFARAVDYGVIMAYDEHEEHDEPGAVASVGYIDKALRRFSSLVAPEKLVLGVGNYGYDWAKGGGAETITNEQAIALAAGYRDEEHPQDVIDFDPEALNPTFEYQDDDDRRHEVWFLDATSAANALTLARGHEIRGAALWALGMEDPSLWRIFGRNGTPNGDLHDMIFPQEAQFVGDGELLRVIRKPQPGARSYEVDPRTNLITDESYLVYPSGWLVQRSGAPKHELALTFDDGPDPRFTPQILDVLARHNVKATFFMIGSNAAANPDLVQRVFDEGHEIGNHSFTHPNMAHASPERVRLELAATERALNAIIGRSVTMFRPPYNADSEPRSYGEIMPVAIANDMGYITAGETIDPLDWDVRHENPDGSIRWITRDDIIKQVIKQLPLGNAILLHDSGGDRSATVAALDELITTLQAKGYRFVTMGELAGLTRAQTMPVLAESERTITSVDDVVFTIERIFSQIVFWGFTGAIVLGLMRIALMTGLSVRTPKAPPPLSGAERPPVTVLVAAYNEEPVIERTIESILASRNVEVRVIVVDDGSTDATAEIVTRVFGADSRVTLMQKPNGGKASALNMALQFAQTPVVIGVDADTQLDGDAIALLLRWFADPKVGAVAGNVKVGNRGSLVTRWQSLEYISSQNIDRRALARLNAITVVPGAVGAWRTDALRAAGGFRPDTLAEDMDLTWRLRRSGWVIANEPGARAYTEVPATLGGLTKQRFRWTFGTLQCLWKHRDAVFRYGWFGGLALPSLWLFQIVAQILAPLVDLQLLLALVSRLSEWIGSLSHRDITPAYDPMIWVILGIYVAFLVFELAAAAIAFAMDGEPKRDLLLLPTQRLVYRQIMYWVVIRAVVRALGGLGHGWGKLKRSGAVRVQAPRV